MASVEASVAKEAHAREEAPVDSLPCGTRALALAAADHPSRD